MVYYTIVSLFDLVEQNDLSNYCSEVESRLLLLQIVSHYANDENSNIKKAANLLIKIIKENEVLSSNLNEIKKKLEKDTHFEFAKTLLIQENMQLGYRHYIYEVAFFIVRNLIQRKLKINDNDFQQLLDDYQDQGENAKMDVLFRDFFYQYYSILLNQGKQITLFQNFDMLNEYYNSCESVNISIIKKMGNIELTLEKVNETNKTFENKVIEYESVLLKQKMDFEEKFLKQNDSLLKQLSYQKADYEEKLSSIKEQLSNQKADYEKKLSDQKADFEEKLSSIKEQLSDQKADYEEKLSNQKADYEEKLSNQKAEIDKLLKYQDSLKSEIETKTKESKEKEKEFEKERQRLSDRIKIVEHQFVSLNRTIERYRLKEQALHLGRNDEEGDNKMLDQLTLEEYHSHMLELENENFSLLLMNNSLQKKIIQYKEKLSRIQEIIKLKKHLCSFYKRKNIRLLIQIAMSLDKIKRDTSKLSKVLNSFRK